MTIASATSAEQAQTGVREARIFVGLKIAPEIASELAQLAAPLKKLSLRLVEPTDIHLTLVPPWKEASPPKAIDKLARVASGFGTFRLSFQHLGYGPQPKRPRLLWADCGGSDEITALRAALLHVYGQIDERPFQPHVTLARIRGNGAAIARKHPIDLPLALAQRIESVELFQSPSPGEIGYRILASLRLGETGGSAPTLGRPRTTNV
jgi:RNA 2',3'-cyclic 3'-phosphodiesterase